MNVLSLFDGISCGQIALERAGIDVENYFASEIDKYAIKVTQTNYPDTVQLGSIEDWRSWDLPKIDLILAGSPCQGFSFAGKQLGLDDPRSKLFYTFVDVLKHYNPEYFLLENVVMSQENNDVISCILGEMYPHLVTQKQLFQAGRLEPIMINSALVSAQNRQRLYWTSIKGVKQPEDRKILLADIIENGVVDRDKSYCIDANYWKGGTIENYMDKARRQIVFEPVAFTETRTEEAKKIRSEYKKRYDRDFSPRRAKEMIARTDGKMNCLTATYSMKENTILDERITYRKLTPTECERLQTVPGNYTDCVSNTQRYKMLGNGWTVDVIAHILKGIK